MSESFVDTTGGRYRGIRSNGVDTYLGIRYGEATGGARRFLPSIAAAPHAGTVDALAFGLAAPQFDPRLAAERVSSELAALYFPRGGGQVEGSSTGEDCLVLNVWTPNMDGAAKLPVMVWFHGGMFRMGSGSATATYGENLAKTGRAVVVTVNHRLGLFAHLSLGHLLGDEYSQSGAAGFTDLVLALEWVRANIASFGGDPGNVTIFGQSGGGAKALALLRTPRAKDLFRRTIVQSTAGDFLDPAQGETQTERVLTTMGLSVDSAHLLLELPVDAVLRAQRMIDSPGIAPLPTTDGDFLLHDVQAEEILSTDGRKPMLIGATTHEPSLLFGSQDWYRSIDDGNLVASVDRFLPGQGRALEESYRERFPGESPHLVFSRILSDRTFGKIAAGVSEEKSAGGAPVFRYEFGYTTDAGGGILGSPHCMEIPFIFDTGAVIPLAGSRPDREELTVRVQEAWLSFAETGVPVLPDGSLWPLFDAERSTPSTVHIDSGDWHRVTSMKNSAVEFVPFV